MGCQAQGEDEDGGDGDRWWVARHTGRMRMEVMGWWDARLRGRMSIVHGGDGGLVTSYAWWHKYRQSSVCVRSHFTGGWQW